MTKKYILALFLFFTLVLTTYYCEKGINSIEYIKQDSVATDSKANCTVKEINEDNEKYTIKGYIPCTNYKILNEKIKSTINADIEQFKKDASESIPVAEGLKLAFDFTFDSYDAGNYVSYVINEYINLGGAHPNTYVKTISYDIKNNKVVTIQDLLKGNSKIIEQLSSYTRNELSNNSILKEVNDKDMLKAGTAAKIENFSRFAFDKKGLIIFFEKYQVAPYVAGDFTVTVPYDKINLKIK